VAEGVFQTDRAIFLNQIWKNPAKFRLFFFLYGNAIFADAGTETGGIHVAKGQYLRSYRNLCDDLEYLENHSLKKYSLSHIKKMVDELVLEKRLSVKSTELGTLFTVLNYEQYQGFERFKKDNTEQRKNGARTERERSENNNKNVNNVKNDKNNINTDIVEIVAYLNQKAGTRYQPSSEKTRSLINARFNDNFTKRDFEIVIDKKCTAWLRDSKMVKFLRPETLFGTKFEGYLNEKQTVSIPKAYASLMDYKEDEDEQTGYSEVIDVSDCKFS